VTRWPAVLALALAGWSAPAAAVSLTLSPQEKSEALAAGQRSVTRDGFDAEWRVANGAGESVTVVTPFHRLVLAARHAAFRNERLKAGEPDRLLKEQGDRLVLWVSLRGDREDFARYYEPRLLVGELEIAPSFVQNERTAVRTGDGAFLARCVYGFPTQALAGKPRVALVIRDPDGRDVSRFTLDLSAMR
jgi:hypothetical protein